MKSARGSLLVELVVDCPNCDNNYINILDESETGGIDHNEDGHILRQSCPDGFWPDAHDKFEVEGVTCQECGNKFNVEGLDW